MYWLNTFEVFKVSSCIKTYHIADMLGTGDAAHGLPVVLTAVARPGDDVRTIEAQTVRVVETERGRGPIVPVRATMVGRARAPVPGIDEIIRELAKPVRAS